MLFRSDLLHAPWYNYRVNKLIPILSVIFAAFAATVSICGLILVSVACSVPQLALFAVPVALSGASVSALLTTATAFFLKSKLCKFSLAINACALALSAISIIIWLIVL